MSKHSTKDRHLTNLNHFVNMIPTHARVLTITFGSLFVSGWTLLRFFIKPTTFDLVGQQVLLRQWTQGLHSGATVGPTNYILKMLIIYTPLQWLPGSPRLKLVLITLIINILTFVLIVLLLEKLIRYFFPDIKRNFYLACLWLSLIAGSMYWIQFSNSRNIEVAGGLFFIYLAFQYLKQPSKLKFILISLYLSLLVFADPLQLYMTVIPILIFELIISSLEVRNRKKFYTWATLAITGVLGFLGSRLFVLIVKKIWNINFISLTTHTNGYSLFGAIIHGVVPAVKQIARLYVGGYEYGRYVEGLNLALVVGILLIGLWYALKNLLPKKFIYFLLSFWVIDIGFYIASGQALQSQTSRYLIMTIPIFILLLATVLSIKTKLQSLITIGIWIVIVIDAVVLIKNVSVKWDTSFSKDNHLYSAIDYLKQHDFSFAYSSMDTALPSDYYSGGKVTILPLSCSETTLAPSYLFFDKSVFNKSIAKQGSVVPLILDGTQINNFPSVCSLQSIETQLGPWQSIEHLSDGSDILMYRSSQITEMLGLAQK